MSRLNRILNWPELAQQSVWNVADLAQRCSVSVRRLEQHFLETFGQSPKAWMNTQRQKQAVKFLSGGASVKETAISVGYAHASTFSREFKKCTGQWPRNSAK